MTQENALKILKTGVNVFLTGEPGSGKSHTIREYVEYLRNCNVEPAITASTGIAATHIHGLTIHSFAGIGIKKHLSKYDIEAIAHKPHIYKRIDKAKVLIIDEVSMLDADTLESVDVICREVKRKPMQAFGGIQVVFVGDFFQLPPVIKKNTKEENPTFAYYSKSWRDANVVVCYLHEQFRQDDRDYLEILSAIRKNNYGTQHELNLRDRIGDHDLVSENITRLFSHNQNVDELNNKRLKEIDGEIKIFEMEAFGKESLRESLKRGCLSPERLELKVGAVVMCTKNNSIAGYVNGTLGVVERFAKGTGFPVIKTLSGKTIEISTDEWAVEENGKIKARIVQVPLRLAWAITIHKSQGMSMDAAVMDLSEVFEYGQGYVALSRVRRLSGLYLKGYNEKALQVHPEILSKDKEFKRSSAEARKKFEFMENDELLSLHKNFITAIGGTFNPEGNDKKINILKSKKKKTEDVTLDFLRDGKNIKEIAEIRGIKNSTIIDHITLLFEFGKIDKNDLSILMPKNSSDENVIKSIQNALKTIGNEKLKPIFEHFEGQYSYDAIKLAKLLLPLE